MSTVTYKNYYGDVYYLYKKKTAKGNWCYYFSKTQKEELVESIPDGYEIDEKPDGKVYLVIKNPQIISNDEKNIVEESVKKYSKAKYFRVYVKDEKITVYLAQDNIDSLREIIGPIYDEKKFRKVLSYSPMMQFCLLDEEERIFNVERYCFRGSIDDWIFLNYGKLKDIAPKYCSYLGKETFYDLI